MHTYIHVQVQVHVHVHVLREVSPRAAQTVKAADHPGSSGPYLQLYMVSPLFVTGMYISV